MAVAVRISEEMLPTLSSPVFSVRMTWVIVGHPMQREMASPIIVRFAVIFDSRFGCHRSFPLCKACQNGMFGGGGPARRRRRAGHASGDLINSLAIGDPANRGKGHAGTLATDKFHDLENPLRSCIADLPDDNLVAELPAICWHWR